MTLFDKIKIFRKKREVAAIIDSNLRVHLDTKSSVSACSELADQLVKITWIYKKSLLNGEFGQPHVIAIAAFALSVGLKLADGNGGMILKKNIILSALKTTLSDADKMNEIHPWGEGVDFALLALSSRALVKVEQSDERVDCLN